MMRKACLGVCTLNQWAMDFTGNCSRILESILKAKQKGATYRSGPELEITGYNCGDHFLESDTFLHSWEVVAYLLERDDCCDILVDVGMPVMHKNVAYNCRVVFLNKKVVLIRPKTMLCDGGVYRESRWFTAWCEARSIEEFHLPDVVKKVSGQVKVPIGLAVLATSDARIGFEICEELWNPLSSHIGHYLEGVDITVNSSGGFHQVGNTRAVLGVIKSATRKCGGAYLFSNLRGSDGERTFYHGTCHVALNGKTVAIGRQFCLEDVEVVVASVDLDDVTSYRRGIVRPTDHEWTPLPTVHVDYTVCSWRIEPVVQDEVELPDYEEGEELALGPACWLWDCLRGGFKGVVLPLNGDIESGCSAIMVYSMCTLICDAVKEGNLNVLDDLRKILEEPNYVPETPEKLCNKILITCEFRTESGRTTEAINVKELVSEIGCGHLDIKLYQVVQVIIGLLSFIFKDMLQMEDRILENSYPLFALKERLKLIFAYLLAEIFCSSKTSRRHLVLGTGNAEVSLSGRFVKYGRCSGDFNLTAASSRTQLLQFLSYSKKRFGFHSLKDELSSKTPFEWDRSRLFLRTDEFRSNDLKQEILSNSETTKCALGFQDYNNLPFEFFEEIEEFERLRKQGYGPHSSVCKSIPECECSVQYWMPSIAVIKKIFSSYSSLRHNVSTIAPTYHSNCFETTNSFHDQRPLLYKCDWSWQLKKL